MTQSRFVPLLFAALVLVPVGADAAPLPRALLDQLHGIDTVPTADELLAIDPEVVDRLYEAARDDELDGYARARAISLLSQLPTPRSLALLTDLALVGPDELRSVAIYTAGRAFGQKDPDAALSLVQAFVDAGSVRVRQYAIRALRWIDRPEATRALLLSRDPAEDDPGTKRLIAKTLERIAPAKADQ